MVTSIAFIALHIVGDPISLLSAEDATNSERQALRQAYGLEQPLPVQYLIFLGKTIQGDFGRSFYSAQPAMKNLLERFPATLELVFTAIGFGLLIGIPIGVQNAAHVGSSFDKFCQFISSLFISAPTFWIGILLIYFFAVQWQLLPSQGSGSPAHLILPALTLALPRAAIYQKMIRNQLLEVLTQDSIRTARAKGVPEFKVLYKHALRNALIPFLTILGMQFAGLLSGAAITESLFAYPGMNRVALEALNRLDAPVILAFVLLSAFIYICINFITDALYVLIDPRVRYE